jgi:hypothetical protein
MNYSNLLNFLLIILILHGGPLLVDLLSQIISLLNNSSVIIAASVTPTIIVIARFIRVFLGDRSKEARKKPVKITIEIDGSTITVDAPNLENAAELVKRFQDLHPIVENQVTSKNEVKVTGKASKEIENR